MKRLTIILLFVCQFGYTQQRKTSFTDYIQPAVFSLSMVMMHDVVNPPAACRFYSYAMMSAYSIVAAHNKEIPDAALFIRSYPGIVVHDSGRVYDHRIAAVYSILETGKLMLPS